MSVSGISASSSFSYQALQAKEQQFQKDFQQLGADLQSGNLSQAQADFTTLQSDSGQSASSSQSNSNPIATAFNQLSQDLQSGNLAAAQQDYSTIQQDFQQQGTQSAGHPHHHHHAGSSQDSNSQNPIDQLFSQLGQALQSGNLATAQSAYASLQQDFSQLGSSALNTASTATPSSTSSNSSLINISI